MRTLLIATLFLALPVVGADFRGTEFGSSCAAVEEREKALGSESPVVSVNGDAYRFKGQAFKRDVWITYLCKDGKLSSGDYHFFAQGRYEDAVGAYLVVFGSLSSLYGAPSVAYARHDDGTVQFDSPSVNSSIRDEYTASWRTPDLFIGLALRARGDYSGDNWHTMVVVAPTRE